MRRKTLTYALAIASLAACWLYVYQSNHVPWSIRLDLAGADWNSRREEVKSAFANSWDAYEKHAWGAFSTTITKSSKHEKLIT